MGEPRRDEPTRPRPLAATAAPGPRPEARPRPDPNPMRLMAGFVGLASLTAIATGLLPSVVPAASAGAGSGATTVPAETAALPVKHVTRYVQLQPGQTAPPQASVVAAPRPTPRVVIVTTTRQSGKP